MKLRRVTLIEPKAPGYHVYNRIQLPRIGLPLLGAILKRRGVDVRIFCQGIDGIDFDVVLKSDLVGISTTTSTAPEAYRIADKVRAQGIPVALGGSHVTFLTDEALEHCDFCVRGEGEGTFCDLIDCIEAGDEPVGVKGLSYKRGDEIVHNEDRPLNCDLDSLPFPDFSLVQKHEKISLLPIAMSRGCPYGCNFCSVTRMFGRGYRFRSVDNVVEEVRHLMGLKLIPQNKLFFYDDNFAANRNHTKELLERMISEGLTKGFTAQVRSDVVRDRELMGLLKRSGCYYAYVGFESVNQNTLDEFNKGQKVEEIVESIRLLHEYGIMVHGMFVLGSDSDTSADIWNTVKFALKNKIDTVQLVPLVPLPGTPYFKQMEDEGRLLTRNWELYDGQHVVYRPKNMSPYEMQHQLLLAYKKFYSLYETGKMLLSPEFLTTLANFSIGRWNRAATQIRRGAYSSFHRAYGHILLKQFARANAEFTDQIKHLAEGAKAYQS